MPGQELFAYLDSDGEAVDVTSDAINAYLREISGHPFTAKHFRTWAGTVLAAQALQALGEFSTESEARHNLVAAVERVAGMLGNTPAICRKSYIHPIILDGGRLISSRVHFDSFGEISVGSERSPRHSL